MRLLLVLSSWPCRTRHSDDAAWRTKPATGQPVSVRLSALDPSSMVPGIVPRMGSDNVLERSRGYLRSVGQTGYAEGTLVPKLCTLVPRMLVVVAR